MQKIDKIHMIVEYACCTYFLSSLAALIAAFSSSVFSSVGASADMKRAELIVCFHDDDDDDDVCFVMAKDDVCGGAKTNGDKGALFVKKAETRQGPLLPTARRILADVIKRSMCCIDTM